MIIPLRNRLRLALTRLTVASVTVALAMSAPVRAAGAGNADIFSTPDTQTPPTFSKRMLQTTQFTDPLLGPSGDPPGRDSIRAIPSMTGQQLGTLDKIIFSNRDAITPLQEELSSLRRILDRRKKQTLPAMVENAGPPSAPDVLNRGGGAMMMESPATESGSSVAYADEPDDAINARIEMLTEQISDTKNSLWPSIRRILSPDQLKQLQLMRSGQLVISSTASTDIPEPQPAATAVHPFHAPATVLPPRSSGFSAGVPHALASPIMYTTKQLLYRALWRL